MLRKIMYTSYLSELCIGYFCYEENTLKQLAVDEYYRIPYNTTTSIPDIQH